MPSVTQRTGAILALTLASASMLASPARSVDQVRAAFEKVLAAKTVAEDALAEKQFKKLSARAFPFLLATIREHRKDTPTFDALLFGSRMHCPGLAKAALGLVRDRRLWNPESIDIAILEAEKVVGDAHYRPAIPALEARIELPYHPPLDVDAKALLAIDSSVGSAFLWKRLDELSDPMDRGRIESTLDILKLLTVRAPEQREITKRIADNALARLDYEPSFLFRDRVMELRVLALLKLGNAGSARPRPSATF